MAPISLLLDEDVWPGLAQALREQGVDVVSVHETERTGLADENQMAYAASEKRALMTHNAAHFVALATDYFQRGQQYSGIIIALHYNKGDLIRRTISLLSALSAEELENTIRFV